MSVRLVKILAGMLLTLATVAAVACGGDDGNSTASPTASPTPAPTGPTAVPTPTPPPATTPVGIELSEFIVKPTTLRARPGTAVFTVKNTGTVTHQFLVIRSDLPTAELPRAADNHGVDESQVDIAGKIEAIAAGDSAELSVPVGAGKYVLVCNLFAGGKSHYLTGMYTQFEVTQTAPDPNQTPVPSATLIPSPS